MTITHVFLMRYAITTVKPRTATAALKACLDQHAAGKWKWSKPRWADAKHHMMSVVFSDQQAAEDALANWRVPV